MLLRSGSLLVVALSFASSASAVPRYPSPCGGFAPHLDGVVPAGTRSLYWGGPSGETDGLVVLRVGERVVETDNVRLGNYVGILMPDGLEEGEGEYVLSTPTCDFAFVVGEAVPAPTTSGVLSIVEQRREVDPEEGFELAIAVFSIEPEPAAAYYMDLVDVSLETRDLGGALYSPVHGFNAMELTRACNGDWPIENEVVTAKHSLPGRGYLEPTAPVSVTMTCPGDRDSEDEHPSVPTPTPTTSKSGCSIRGAAAMSSSHSAPWLGLSLAGLLGLASLRRRFCRGFLS